MSNILTPNIQGIYAITPDTIDTSLLVESIELVLLSGVKILQYRNKIVSNTQAIRQAEQLQEICKRHHSLFIINDNLQMAKDINADGVHLGKDDFNMMNNNLQKIRQESNLINKIIGISCYNNLDLASTAIQQQADYIAFGAVFPSSTKVNAPKVAIEILNEATHRFNAPIVAIGGINFKNIEILISNTKINCFAMINALFEILMNPKSTDSQKEIHLNKITELQQLLTN